MKCILGSIPSNYGFYKIGKFKRIILRQDILTSERTASLFNNETMGALDNYAKHENLHVYIKSNKLGDKIRFAIYKGRKIFPKTFIIATKEAEENFSNFLRVLYTNVEKAQKKLNDIIH